MLLVVDLIMLALSTPDPNPGYFLIGLKFFFIVESLKK